jgi:hypothetical protein
MTPSVQQLRLAPELAVLHALDAALAGAARVLRAEHPLLGNDFVPDGRRVPVLRAGEIVYHRLRELRAALRSYRAAVRELHYDLGADDDDIPF